MYFIFLFLANLTENLDEADFSIRGRFKFLDNKIRFNAIRSFMMASDKKIEKLEKLNTSSNYSMNIVFNPVSNILLSHSDTGEAIVEGEYNLWQNKTNEHNFRMYGKHIIKGVDNITTTNQIVYNYGQDYMLNFGVRDWKIKSEHSKTDVPETFTVGSIMKIANDANLHSWAGMQFAFGLRSFSEVQALIGINSFNNFNGIIQFGIQRKVETEITPLTESKLISKVTYPKIIKIGLESKLSDTFHLYNTFSSNIDNNVTMQAQIGGLYAFDPNTTLKFKVSDDLSTTVSITRRFKNLFDFTFVGNFALTKSLRTEVETTKSTTKILGHVSNVSTDVVAKTTSIPKIKSKFGINLTLFDED